MRSRDLSGLGKALWVLVVVVLPLIGVLIYMIVRGSGYLQRQQQRAEAAAPAADDGYVGGVAGDSSAATADQLAELANLRERGVISDDEFQREKARVPGS
jgi:hypothetical protein